MGRFAFLLYSIAFSLPVQAQNWEKDISAIDELFNRGDYKGAANKNSKFKKDIDKKLGNDHPYQVLYKIKAARNNLAQGYLVDFEQHIGSAVATSVAINNKESREHAYVLIEVSSLYIEYGNFILADNYLDKSQQILESNGGVNEDDQVVIDFNRASISLGKGFYTDAINDIDGHLDYYKKRAISKEARINEKGKLKTKKLSKEDIFVRFGDYAKLLNLKSRALWKKGDFNAADLDFEKNEHWIGDQKELGRKSAAYTQNKLWHWQMLNQYGVKKKEIRKNFEEIMFKIKVDHHESHILVQEVYESLLQIYLENNDESRYKNLRAEYEHVIEKYFKVPKRKSLYEINLTFINLNSRLDRDRTKNLEKNTLLILKTADALPVYHSKRLELLEFLYQVSLADQRYQDAQSYAETIVDIQANLYGKEAVEYHLGQLKLAEYYLSYSNKYDEAKRIYIESFDKIVKPQIETGHIDYIEILNNRAIYYESTDQYTEASKILDEALQVTRVRYDNLDYAYGIELEKIAGLQIKIGEYEKAEKNINEALAILEGEKRNGQTVIFYVKGLETNAKLKAIKGELGDAEDNLYRARRMYARATNLIGYDELASNIDMADLNILFGNYSRARGDLEDALESYEKYYGQDSRKLVQPLVSLGRLRVTAGEYSEARQFQQRASDIAVATYGENSTKIAPTLLLASEIDVALGDYEEAEEFILQSVEIEESQFGRSHVNVAKSLSQLGIVKLYKNDDAKEIESIFEESRKIIKEKLGDKNPLYANVLTRLAEVYIYQQRYEHAFGILNLSYSIWELSVDRKKNVNKASILELKGDVFYFLKRYGEAESNYIEARSIINKFFGKNHPDYVNINSKLAKVYYMEGDSKKAKKAMDETLLNRHIFIKDYFPALSEREKTNYYNTIRPDFEFYNTLALELRGEFPEMQESMMNNALSTKALLLNSSLKIRERIITSGDSALIAKFNDWQSKKEFLIVAINMSLSQLEENAIDLGDLGDEVEELERQLSEQSELFAGGVSKEITWENVKESLNPNEVAIEMVRFRYFNHTFTDSVVYAGLYVNEDTKKRPDIFLIYNGRELETKYFKYYQTAIVFKMKDRFSFQNYWEPIVNAVGNSSTIYLSADGIYNQINLEAIPTGDGRYVIDDSNIIMVSNTKDIYLRKQKVDQTKVANTATMFGNPTFYVASAEDGPKKVIQLPGTEIEVNELNALLNQKGWLSEAFLELDATESQIKKLDNPRVFHIATHGFFMPEIEDTGDEKLLQNAAAKNPLLRTGLMLVGAGDIMNKTDFNYNIDDGILTAYEAMNLRLDHTDLVVLSACETGLGDITAGEGVYGLQRAFIVAGAKTLIMSMFKVDDEATQKLMVNFYQKWIETGNKRQSFIDAKKELRNEFKEPIYWGAFIMIGLD